MPETDPLYKDIELEYPDGCLRITLEVDHLDRDISRETINWILRHVLENPVNLDRLGAALQEACKPATRVTNQRQLPTYRITRSKFAVGETVFAVRINGVFFDSDPRTIDMEALRLDLEAAIFPDLYRRAKKVLDNGLFGRKLARHELIMRHSKKRLHRYLFGDIAVDIHPHQYLSIRDIADRTARIKKLEERRTALNAQIDQKVDKLGLDIAILEDLIRQPIGAHSNFSLANP